MLILVDNSENVWLLLECEMDSGCSVHLWFLSCWKLFRTPCAWVHGIFSGLTVFSIVLSSHWYNLSACTVVFNALYITEKGTKVIFCLTLLMHTTSSSNSEMLSWKIQPKRKKKQQNHTATKKNEGKLLHCWRFLFHSSIRVHFFLHFQYKFIWMFDIEQCDKQCIDCTTFASFVIITIMTTWLCSMRGCSLWIH